MILFIAFLFASFAASVVAAVWNDEDRLHPSRAAAELVFAVVLPISSVALALDVTLAFRFSDITRVRIRLLTCTALPLLQFACYNTRTKHNPTT